MRQVYTSAANAYLFMAELHCVDSVDFKDVVAGTHPLQLGQPADVYRDNERWMGPTGGETEVRVLVRRLQNHRAGLVGAKHGVFLAWFAVLLECLVDEFVLDWCLHRPTPFLPHLFDVALNVCHAPLALQLLHADIDCHEGARATDTSTAVDQNRRLGRAPSGHAVCAV